MPANKPLIKPDLIIHDENALDGEVPARAMLLRADALDAVKTLAAAGESGLTVVRYLVESYYDYQVSRIEALHRSRGALEAGAPKRLMAWLTDRNEETEIAIRTLLDNYTKVELTGMGMWARGIVGIGPVISAALLAYINMNIATNPSKIWRYFGLDPSRKWIGTKESKALLERTMAEHGNDLEESVVAIAMVTGANPENLLRQATTGKDGAPIKLTKTTLERAMAKRPWNASAKVLAWKIGDSFCKQHNRPGAFYGKLYADRKMLELRRDAAGDFKALAARTLTEKHFTDKGVLAVYESGHLPLGRIELRARRYAVKIFLSHWWAEAYKRRWKREAPRAWAIEPQLGGHADEIMPPQSKVA